MKIDPEFRDLIPSPSSEELDGLRESIQAHGCLDPLIVWKEQGVLLDGHHRHGFCEEIGVGYRTTSISLPDRGSALIWVIDHQSIHRRNLSKFSRCELALKKKSILAIAAAERKRIAFARAQKATAKARDGKDVTPCEETPAPTVQNSGQRVDHELAEGAGVSHDTIHKASVLQQKADPETIQKLREEGVDQRRV